ncbi:unnamed protein product [Amoebophrya sp. A25]|nr:unnamed protein product [Amoebophrya sp. A25]|eukprot:GSA25T00027892001.1
MRSKHFLIRARHFVFELLHSEFDPSVQAKPQLTSVSVIMFVFVPLRFLLAAASHTVPGCFGAATHFLSPSGSGESHLSQRRVAGTKTTPTFVAIKAGDFVELNGLKRQQDLNGLRGLALYDRKLLITDGNEDTLFRTSTTRTSGAGAAGVGYPQISGLEAQPSASSTAPAVFTAPAAPPADDAASTRWAVLLYNGGDQRIVAIKPDNLKRLDLTKTPMDSVLSPDLFNGSPCSNLKHGELINQFVVSPREQLKKFDDKGDHDAAMEIDEPREDPVQDPEQAQVYKQERYSGDYYRDVYDVGIVVDEKLPDSENAMTITWAMKVWWFTKQSFSWEDLEVVVLDYSGSVSVCSWTGKMTRHKNVVDHYRNTKYHFLLNHPRRRGDPSLLAEVRRAIDATEKLQQKKKQEAENSVFQSHVIEIATMSAHSTEVEKRQKEALFERFSGYYFHQHNGYSNDRHYRFVKRRGRVLLEFTDFGEMRSNYYRLNLDTVEFVDFAIQKWPPEITGGMSWMLNKWPTHRDALFASHLEDAVGGDEHEDGPFACAEQNPIELVLSHGPATEVFRRAFPYEKDKFDGRNKPSADDARAGRQVPVWIPFSEHYPGETRPCGQTKPKYEQISHDVVLHVLPNKILKMWESVPVSFEKRNQPPYYELRRDPDPKYRLAIPE